MPDSALPLPDGWSAVEEPIATALVGELAREMAATHHLHGKPLLAVARADGNDDVLFRRLDVPGAYCVVHLTWAASPEATPFFPSVEFEGTLGAFAAWVRAADPA